MMHYITHINDIILNITQNDLTTATTTKYCFFLEFSDMWQRVSKS